MLKSNQDETFDDKKFFNLDSVLIIRSPNSDNEMANKKHVDNSKEKGNNLRFNQTKQNYKTNSKFMSEMVFLFS